MASERSLQLAAQAWCTQVTAHMSLNKALAEAFADILDRETGIAVDVGRVLTPGCIVLYTLSEKNVQEICARPRVITWDRQRFFGNPPLTGNVVPAIVIYPHYNLDEDPFHKTFNGQAFLDGNETLWLMSVPYDRMGRPGTWHWPDE